MDKAKLLEVLRGKESPFTWKIPSVTDVQYVKYIVVQTEKFQHIQEEHAFKWTRFIISLQLSYELSVNSTDHQGALTYVRWCKDHLLQLHRKQRKEPLFSHLFSTLLYIVSVTEAMILLQSDQLEKAHEVINGWPFTSGLCSVKNASVLLGVKAALYLQYGSEGHRMALDAARKARDLDPDQAEWWFLIGNALGRIRRTENRTITDEEKSAIEKAFALEKNASYTVHLGTVYADYSSYLFYNQEQEKSQKYAVAAVSRYREALTMRADCVILKARIAHGMLRIRDREARDIPFAKQLLDEVVQAAPNNAMAYHDLGYYYERFARNTKEAILCLEKANEIGNVKALLYLMTIKWRHGMKENMIDDLKEGLSRYSSDESQACLLACLGACHALVNDDWDSAIDCIQKSLRWDMSANYLEKFQGYDNRSVNLLALVANHLHHDKRRPNRYTDFLEFVKGVRPDVIYPVGTKRYRFIEWKKDLNKIVRKDEDRPVHQFSPRPWRTGN